MRLESAKLIDNRWLIMQREDYKTLIKKTNTEGGVYPFIQKDLIQSKQVQFKPDYGTLQLVDPKSTISAPNRRPHFSDGQS